MDIIQLLEEHAGIIVDTSVEALERASLKHYKTSGSGKNRERLNKLFELIMDSIRQKNLIPMVEYSEQVARERFQEGFDIQEVQSAYNVLEEVLWKQITENMSPDDYPEAFGLVSTVLGAGKQALAIEYVSLACKRHVRSLDLSFEFQGG